MTRISPLCLQLLFTLISLATPCNGIDDYRGSLAPINEYNRDYWIARGETLLNESKYNEAIEAYDRAIELNSSCIDAWRQKGNAFSNLSKFDEALLCYEKVICMCLA